MYLRGVPVYLPDLSGDMEKAVKTNNLDQIKEHVKNMQQGENAQAMLEEILLAAFVCGKLEIIKYLLEEQKITVNKINRARLVGFISISPAKKTLAAYILEKNNIALTGDQQQLVKVLAGQAPVTEIDRLEGAEAFISLVCSGYVDQAKMTFTRSELKLENSFTAECTILLTLMLSCSFSVKFFRKYPGLLKDVNLNTKWPVMEKWEGVTLLWLLIFTDDGLALFKENPTLLEGCHLDVAPVKGPNRMWVIATKLVTTPVGIEILNKNPKVLARLIATCNLDSMFTPTIPLLQQAVQQREQAVQQAQQAQQAQPRQQQAQLLGQELEAAHQQLQAAMRQLQVAHRAAQPLAMLPQQAAQQAAQTLPQPRNIALWEQVITLPNFTPDLFFTLLKVRGFSEQEYDKLNTLSVKCKLIFTPYKNAFELANKAGLQELQSLLSNKQWLLKTKHGSDGNTLLHTIIQPLDKLPSQELLNAYAEFPTLFSQLQMIKSVENKKGWIAADGVSESSLKKLFASPKVFDTAFNRIFTTETAQIVKDVLSGVRAFKRPLLIINKYEYRNGKPIETKKEPVEVKLEGVIKILKEEISKVNSYIDIDSNMFALSTQATMKQFMEENAQLERDREACKAEFGAALLPNKSLTDSEIEILENFTNNLITLTYHYHKKHLDSRDHKRKREANESSSEGEAQKRSKTTTEHLSLFPPAPSAVAIDAMDIDGVEDEKKLTL